MKNALLLLLLILTFTVVAQNTCESEAVIEDFNSITKCSVESTKSGNNKSSRQISVNISAPKTRFLKKRVIAKKQAATGLGSLNTSGIGNTNHKTDISNSLALKQNKTIDNVALLSKTLSAEELKNAVKFHDISNIPTFESCKSVKGKDKLGCFNKEMIKHIEKHFNYPQEAVVSKIQGKVWVRFVIDKEGGISNIKTLGPKGAKILDEEAVRVVSHLPKFIPGEKDGKKVSVKYGFPISFSLEQD